MILFSGLIKSGCQELYSDRALYPLAEDITAHLIDAVDIIYYNEDQMINKTILETDDAGYTYYSGSDDEWTSPMYCGKSLRRKCSSVKNGRFYLQDTNNSSNDFILGGQTPVAHRSFTSAD